MHVQSCCFTAVLVDVAVAVAVIVAKHFAVAVV